MPRGTAKLEGLSNQQCGDSSASKVLRLLDVIAEHRAPIGVSEAALCTGIPKSTTHRLLKTLEVHGLVGRSGLKYQLGDRLTDLAEVACQSVYGELSDAAADTLAWLFERTGATVQVGVLKGGEVMLIDKIPGTDGTRTLRTRSGTRFPANASALGKALLAFADLGPRTSVLRNLKRVTPYSVLDPRLLCHQLAEVRASGYSFENEEAHLGVRCVGAPVAGTSGVIAAVSLCSSKPLTPSTHGRLIREGAARISRLLGA